MVTQQDRNYMLQALRLARKGRGRTSPNPCVGAVVVRAGIVVGRGYHKKAGAEHAEVLALQEAGDRARDSVMYVTLEPCNHTGRTGPCSHAVADSGIQKVVIGMLDPNPLVDGSGADYLRKRGIEVVSGILEKECRALNRAFIKHITTGLPLVTMKAGLSLDGRITYRSGCGGAVTGPESGRAVHRLRDLTDSILVGASTVLIDNPALTTRLATKKGRDPVRIILDTKLRLPEDRAVFRSHSAAPAWIFCSEQADTRKMAQMRSAGVVVHTVATRDDGQLNLREVLAVLGCQGIISLLVEGGAAVHGSFLKERLVDRAQLFYAPIFVGDGGMPLFRAFQASADRQHAIHLQDVKTRKFGDDLMIAGDVVYP